MAKVDLAAELADVAPEDANEPKPDKPKPPPSSERKRGSGARSRAKTADPVAAEVERLAAEAKAAAEAEAAEAVGDVRPETNEGPKLSKADRERIRRAGRRTITAELSPAQGARLDVLAEQYGSQRAALGAAIDALYADRLDDH